MTYKDEMGPLPHSAECQHGMHVKLEKSINGLNSYQGRTPINRLDFSEKRDKIKFFRTMNVITS